MIEPEIRDFDCMDHDPIDEYVPDRPDVCYWLTVAIGAAGEEGADNFQILVATPKGLKALKQAGHKLGPEPPIVVEPYDWSSVYSRLEARVAKCSTHTWTFVMERLRRSFRWEYEGMR